MKTHVLVAAAAAAAGPSEETSGDTSVVIAVPQHSELHDGDGDDDQEQHPGDRAGVAEPEVDESALAAMELNGPWAADGFRKAGIDLGVVPVPVGAAGPVTVASTVPMMVAKTIGPVGDAGSSDVGARADALPVTVGGHTAYGVATFPRTGYRRPVGTGVATGSQPESMYEVASGTNATNGCCSDFGNVENASKDTGAAHMDALIISSYCSASPCSGPGPWIQADLENGVFMGSGSSNPANTSLHSPFVTAVLRNDGTANFALDGGDATQPTVPSLYSGALPSGYAPMKKEGGIVLGDGGDDSNAAPGAFFEGAITSGYASNATVASLQTNISSAAYTGTSGGGPGVGIT